MAFGKLQSGHWLAAGRCSEPRFTYVGKDKTPKCTIGIAAGKSKTDWINVVAWRDLAYVLYGAHRGDSVLAFGLLHEHEWEGRVYKDIQAEYIGVAQRVDPYTNAAAPPAPAAANAPDWTEQTEEDDGELPF